MLALACVIVAQLAVVAAGTARLHVFPVPIDSMAARAPPSSSQGPPAAINFTAVDVRGWSLDGDPRKVFLLSSFEGIVNKDVADLFIINNNGANRWLQDLNATFPYNGSWLPVANLPDLLLAYESRIQGVVIWDDLPESANIATPLCGIHDSVMIHAGLYPEASAWPALSGKPVTANLTAIYAARGFNASTHPAEIYRWAFDTYFSQCNQGALGMYDAVHAGGIRSQLCGGGIFTFWQPMYCEGDPERDRDDAMQQATFQHVLDNSPVNMVVFGYMFPRGCNEHPVVSRLSARGKYLVPSDWFEHVPFWQNLPLPDAFSFNQSASRDISAIPLEDKVYVAGIYSDGDNLQYVANFMKSQLWDDRHGAVPTTYEMSPSILTIAPAMAMVYYNHMTPSDYFVNGVGGKGYVKSGYATPAFFDIFWQDTRDLMRVLDQREVRTWNSGDIARIVSIMNRQPASPGAPVVPQADAIIEGYGGSDPSYPVMVDGVPFTGMMGYGAVDASEYEAEKDTLLRRLAVKPAGQPLFIVIHMNCWDSPYGAWEAFVNAAIIESGGEIMFVTAGQLSALMARANLLAGDAGVKIASVLLAFGVPGVLYVLLVLRPSQRRARGEEGVIA